MKAFSVSNMRTPLQLREEALMISVEKAIRRIVDFRKEHKIVPARAPWRELREVLTPEEWTKLEQMVKIGLVKEYRGIHYPSYEVDYTALRAFERESMS